MNLLDLLLVLGLLYAAARGYRQGALSQVAAFGGAAAGLVLGAIFAPDLAGALVASASAALALVTFGILLAGVLAGQGIGFALGLRLRTAANEAGAGALDRAGGIIVGMVGLLLTVWLLAGALAQGPSPTVAREIRDSQIVALIDQGMPPPPDLFSRVGAYLDRQGFPQVVSGLGGGPTAPPVDQPTDEVVAAAAASGSPSVVQIQALGCGGISSGTGFVSQAGFVVTNAHVVAGGETVTVRDAEGIHEAVAVHFDPDLDLAVLSAPDTAAPAIAWAGQPAGREVAGATLGYTGGRAELVVRPAAVRGRGTAIGRDIYGRDLVTREVLTLSSAVQRGDSGGPFVTGDGRVAGVVFASAVAERDTSYALPADGVEQAVADAIARNTSVAMGECRF
ncbi:MAG TPA: MarP family serine protease [Egibacteraceae bacterium]|nr:MarP family serine protease [Egibacteraceae bacterium]